MVTIRDVARRAGVSVGTASNVLNGKASVSPLLRERVIAAVQDLDFRPDQTARSLRSRETRFVGLVIGNLLNPTFLPYIKTVEDTLYSAGYHVLMGNSDNDAEKEAELIRQLVSRKVEGVVLTPVRLSEERVATLRKAQVPCVLTLRPHKDRSLETVVPDYTSGSLEATRHLVRLGHVRIAHMMGPDGWSTAQARQEGYVQGLAEAGLPLDRRLVLATNLTMESAYQVALATLSKPNFPTAIIASTDLIAMGVFSAAAELGIRIPEELSVVTFGTANFSMLRRQRPTTVDLGVGDLGRRAAEMLLGRIAGVEQGPARHVLMAVNLIPGYSSASPATRVNT